MISAGRNQPSTGLPGDAGDEIEVVVVMEERKPGRFSGGRDQQVYGWDASVISLRSERGLDLARSDPLISPDRGGRE